MTLFIIIKLLRWKESNSVNWSNFRVLNNQPCQGNRLSILLNQMLAASDFWVWDPAPPVGLKSTYYITLISFFICPCLILLICRVEVIIALISQGSWKDEMRSQIKHLEEYLSRSILSKYVIIIIIVIIISWQIDWFGTRYIFCDEEWICIIYFAEKFNQNCLIWDSDSLWVPSLHKCSIHAARHLLTVFTYYFTTI